MLGEREQGILFVLHMFLCGREFYDSSTIETES